MQQPTLNSNAQAWIDWHQSLRKTLGQKDANDLFMQLWRKVGQGSNANDGALRAYAKTQGLAIEGEYSVLSSLSDTWQSTNTGAKKIGSAASIGVFLVILMLVAAVYFLFIKKD